MKKEPLDDNARKFTVEAVDPSFLEGNDMTSFALTVDWLETGVDNEKKVAYKKFTDGTVQILLIEKATKDGKRTSVKEKISEEEYEQYLAPAKLHLEKVRHEFEYVQTAIPIQ